MSRKTLPARAAYRDELTRLARSDTRVVCLEADLGGAQHPFKDEHPERFFNLGIAEATMIDVAVGMASAGSRPFVSTFAGFASLRAAESLKLGLGYAGASVAIVAPYAGYSGAWLGGTHHCLEDVALVRAVPGVRIAAPHGEAEMRAVIRRALATGEPHYVRAGRNETYESSAWASATEADDGVWLATGAGDCVVSFGEEATRIALAVTERVPGLAHLHLCYGDDVALDGFCRDLSTYSRVFVVDEHRPAGGTASALALRLPHAEVVSLDVGNDWLSTGGSHRDLLAAAGFTSTRLQELLLTTARSTD